MKRPSVNAPAELRKASTASRVLPVPPAPTIVTTRPLCINEGSLASSRSLPTNVVRGALMTPMTAP